MPGIDVGDGFLIPESDRKYLKKHKLLGKNVLHFYNGLSEITVEKKDQLSQKEWITLKCTMISFLYSNYRNTFFSSLRDNYGVKAINYSGIQLLLFHSPVPVKVELFRTMPTEMFEEFMNWKGATWFQKYTSTEAEDFLRAIEQRDDVYGELPREYLNDILFSNSLILPLTVTPH